MTDKRWAERLRNMTKHPCLLGTLGDIGVRIATEIDEIADELDAAGSERDEELEELAKDADHAHEFMEAHNLHDAGMKIMGRRLRALKDEA